MGGVNLCRYFFFFTKICRYIFSIEIKKQKKTFSIQITLILVKSNKFVYVITFWINHQFNPKLLQPYFLFGYKISIHPSI